MGNASLTIWQLKYNDTGRYICRVETDDVLLEAETELQVIPRIFAGSRQQCDAV